MVANTLGKFVGRLTDSGPKEQEEDPEAESKINSRLFECSDCEITYISESMDSCAECGQPVTAIQNERDLGLIGSNSH